MLLIQFADEGGARRVGVHDGHGRLSVLGGIGSTYQLARDAIRAGRSLEQHVATLAFSGTVALDPLLAAGRVLPPLDHPDPAHCLISGTGLTHLGSAQARDAMHAKLAVAEESLTNSMRIFRWGVEGGKPPEGGVPTQPEWFYKGDGRSLVAPGQPLTRPAFADDGGEEAEIAGLYVISDEGIPWRVGFALGNEFSDHVMERKNYLYLAHSKLRPAALGPELFIGTLPDHIQGQVRVIRANAELWSADVPTGEANMAYSFAGLEHHHFKYAAFRAPGDVHIHFFGAATLSFAHGIELADGDIMEASAPPFTRPLRNPLHLANDRRLPAVRAL
jgi:hypothetical protein